jgi:hypothetical protein
VSKFLLPDGTYLEVSDVSLINGHPDLKPVEKDAQHPQINAVQSFHQPRTVEKSWREKKARPRTGYSNPVEDEEFLKKIQYKGL